MKFVLHERKIRRGSYLCTLIINISIGSSPKMYNKQKVNWPRRIFIHGSYWILNVLFFTVFFSSRNDYANFFKMFVDNLVYLPGGMIFAYFSIYYLIPHFFFQKKIALYIILQLVVLALYPLLSWFTTVTINDPYIWQSTTTYKLANHLQTIIILVFGMVPIASAKIARRFINDTKMKEQLEKQKVEAELRFKEAELKLLKAQIQPHFLFNTLNNLYSLAIEKSEKTPEVIITISDLLSYIIYDCTAEKVSLEKEIKFITNYIALEHLRYDDNLSLSVNITGNFSDYEIAPMILHAFVENSFKHGASKDPGNPWISVVISIAHGELHFAISNSKINADTSEKTGIGIENARKRLDLLYLDRYTLDIINDKNVYSLSLDIRL